MTGRVHISRDVIFNEGAQWAWAADHVGHATDFATDFTIDEPTVEEPAVTTTTSTRVTGAPTDPSTPRSSSSSSPGVPTSPIWTPSFSGAHQSPDIEYATPPGSGLSEQLDADHDDEAPLRFRHVDNIIGQSTPPGFVDRNLEEHLMLASDAEPTSFGEALKHEHWCHAMLDEMTSIEASDTWELVDPPPRVKPIGLKWVYKTKKDATGVITKHKA